MKFAFIITGSIFLQSYCVSDNVKIDSAVFSKVCKSELEIVDSFDLRFCKKTFSFVSTLYRHVKAVHEDFVDSKSIEFRNPSKFKCKIDPTQSFNWNENIENLKECFVFLEPIVIKNSIQD